MIRNDASRCCTEVSNTFAYKHVWRLILDTFPAQTNVSALNLHASKLELAHMSHNMSIHIDLMQPCKSSELTESSIFIIPLLAIQFLQHMDLGLSVCHTFLEPALHAVDVFGELLGSGA